MRYRRVYAKKNKDGSRTLVTYGPAGAVALFLVDALAGVFVGGLIIVGSGIESITARNWIIWCFGLGVPILAWYSRRAGRRR